MTRDDEIFLTAVAHWCRPVWDEKQQRWACDCSDRKHAMVPEGAYKTAIISEDSARRLR